QSMTLSFFIPEDGMGFNESNKIEGVTILTEETKLIFKLSIRIKSSGIGKSNKIGGSYYSEGIRILRNTSDPDNFNERINLFTEKLIQRGYKIAFVNKILRNISHTERLNKLTNKETSINKNTDNYNISFITQYHANAENLQTIIRKHWHLIQDNPQFKNLFDKKPTIAFKRNRNIGEIVKKTLEINQCLPIEIN
ncbi:Hypothetical predicted protein, partial [Mytilus galloprovincialis]